MGALVADIDADFADVFRMNRFHRHKMSRNLTHFRTFEQKKDQFVPLGDVLFAQAARRAFAAGLITAVAPVDAGLILIFADCSDTHQEIPFTFLLLLASLTAKDLCKENVRLLYFEK